MLSYIYQIYVCQNQIWEAGVKTVDSREYFIYLVSCHINTVAPQGEKDISWREIFTLSEKHNLTPIITEEIKLLPREFRPDGNILSSFEMSYDKSTNQYFQKLEALSDLVATLSSNEIPHLIVSGIIINNFYPNAEIRVNSETNVVLKPLDFFDAIDFLRRKGFKVDFFSNNATYLNYKGEIFEITNVHDSINIVIKLYFSIRFDVLIESN